MRDSKILFHARALVGFCLACGLTGCGEADEEDYGETATLLMGNLGDLGDLEPIASSFVIENSGETLIYMSSADLSCEQIMVSRWLGGVEAGAQVIEIVVPSELAVVGKVDVGHGAEVNFAEGGMSSAYERAASTGHVTFTKSMPGMAVEGSFKANYANPAANVEGRFQAEFCEGGQGY